MRSVLWFATMVAIAANGHAQEPSKSEKGKVTKSLYMVTGLHCPPCTATLEGSLKKIKGVESIKVDFKGTYTTIEFQEDIISAQQIAGAISATPHMMGRNMQYGGALVLSVAGVQDEALGQKATAALSKVEGVSKVTLYPKQEAVGIEFNAKGKVTSKQLIDALELAGLKGSQYGAGR